MGEKLYVCTALIQIFSEIVILEVMAKQKREKEYSTVLSLPEWHNQLIMPFGKCLAFGLSFLHFMWRAALESRWLLQDISTKGSSAGGPTYWRKSLWSVWRLLSQLQPSNMVLFVFRARSASVTSKHTFMVARHRHLASLEEIMHSAASTVWHLLMVEGLYAIISHHQGYLKFEFEFWSVTSNISFCSVMSYKRCMGSQKSFSGCWLRKWAAVIKGG